MQPAPVDTDINPANGSFADALKSLMALPRYGSGNEVAAMVAYLTEPKTAFVTGASLASIPGMDDATFQGLAGKAKAGCPVSKLLNATITMNAKLA